jgi:hypothetical protein
VALRKTPGNRLCASLLCVHRGRLDYTEFNFWVHLQATHMGGVWKSVWVANESVAIAGLRPRLHCTANIRSSPF